MGCWSMFRGSLSIEPPITEDDKKEFVEFVRKNSYPVNQRARYAICWSINDIGRLVCDGCKFGEYKLWFKFLFEQFFVPKGYDVFGSLLEAWDGEQEQWSLVSVQNGEFFRPHYDPIHVDLDFWEESAEYTRQKKKERVEKDDMLVLALRRTELKPEQFGGLFDPYEDE